MIFPAPLRLFLSAVALFLSLVPTSAMALEVSPGKEGKCLATLKGPIQKGDAAKIAALNFERPADWPDFEDGSWLVLCLDSPGGSLTEGLKIAEIFRGERYGTYIGDGQSCLSACALIFMFGTAFQHESNALTNRTLHVGGTLGFHQPDLPLDAGRDYSIDDVRAAYDSAIQATLRFLTLAARPRPDSPRPYVEADLLEAMLGHVGQDFFFIDTVNKAGRWQIALTGFQTPPFSDEGLYYACQNMPTWQSSLVGQQSGFGVNEYGYRFSDAPPLGEGMLSARRQIDFAGMATHQCTAAMVSRWGGQATYSLCGYHEEENGQVGPFNCNSAEALNEWVKIPAIAMLPAKTTLEELANYTPTSEPTSTAVSKASLCTATKGTATVINVQNYTSLRQSTGHDTQKLDELPRGSTYPVGEFGTVDPAHPRHGECFQLCRAAKAGRPFNEAALKSCIDSNWLWFKIKGPSGRTGYASAKFLDF